ncbi:MAG TPA: Hpt domain-containing protein [Gammaproteobacteria bacterium]|nr:Hpt domain-containing protein [Gammaproteobacteria bacterium]
MAVESLDELTSALQVLRPEIRAMLSEDLPEDLRRAEHAYSRKEWAALHSHVHRVNGSASFCKLGTLKKVCAEIEAGLKQERLPAAEAMKELSREISRVVTALTSYAETK